MVKNSKEFLGLSFLDKNLPRIVAFCGKGGVGKTTCATATALHFARRKLRTLLISTDPTPSLSDILETNIKGTVTHIKDYKNLDAVELDWELVIEKWKKKFGSEIYEVLSSVLPVGEKIIDYIAGAPGIDEEFALSDILDFYESGKYDVIVWDTAPAGGTLSLIKLQEKLYTHLGEATKMYMRARKAIKALIKGGVKRNPLDIIVSWRNLAQRVLTMLRDKRTSSIIVTIPESLGVRQTERVFRELEAFGMSVARIIVNYVITKEICACQFHKQRAEMQKNYIDSLREKYEKPGVAVLPLLPHEVKGIEAVKKIERLLF